MPQPYGTYECDTDPQKLYYDTHNLDMLLDICKASSNEGG